MNQRRVCIIGAGVSGLVSIKCCLEAGLTPICFDKDHHVGGLWNRKNTKSVPNCTTTNTSKELSCFSDFPMPDEYPNFVPPDRLMDYFYSYALKFDLLKYVEMDTEVIKIESNVSTDHYWTVSTIEKRKFEKAHNFDFLIISTGFNQTAFVPDSLKEKIDKFSGKIVHSSDYRSWHDFENQTVVISGFGNSAGDISSELSRHTKKLFLSTKHGGYILNRICFSGYPWDANLLKRVSGLFPTAIRNIFLKKLCNSMIDHSNFGLESLKTASHVSVIPIINDEVPIHISTGRIVVKPEILSIKENQVTFKDGTTADNVDSIICCTGYKRYFSFLDNDDKVFSFGKEGKTFPLYKNIFPVEHRGKVAFIGTTAVSGSVFPVYELQARCAIEAFVGDTLLPKQDEMRHIIEKDEEKTRFIFGNEARELMRVTYIGYQDDLASMIGVKPNISNFLLSDPRLAFRLFFGPSCPYQYRLVGRHKWNGARNAILTVNERIWAPFKTSKKIENKSLSSVTLFLLLLAIAYFIFLALKL